MNTANTLASLLATRHRPFWKRWTTWLALAALALAVAGGLAWQRQQQAAARPEYVTQPVTRGNLSVSVTATGTLQPTRSVAVGSELSGTVAQVLVDVNDRVKKGQVLVELDRSKLRDAVTGARADLEAARARQRLSAATLEETRAQLARLEELHRISGGKLPAAVELDAARASTERANAESTAAAAAVAQAGTTVSTAQTNLAKASIRSPIDGIVLSRSVEPGNAVAASLQAVTLFTLAEDLRSMKLSVAVDEADVGQLEAGQRARFTVAAQPGREYPARVQRVAYGSTTTDNVVTYTTQLDVANADLSLRPGMTATATIATRERTGVLLVPNSALRYAPAAAAGSEPAASRGGILSRLMPTARIGGGRRGGGQGGTEATGSGGTVWVLRNGTPQAVAVTRGLTDGRRTEITGGPLAEGDRVIVDQTQGAR